MVRFCFLIVTLFSPVAAQAATYTYSMTFALEKAELQGEYVFSAPTSEPSGAYGCMPDVHEGYDYGCTMRLDITDLGEQAVFGFDGAPFKTLDAHGWSQTLSAQFEVDAALVESGGKFYDSANVSCTGAVFLCRVLNYFVYGEATTDMLKLDNNWGGGGQTVGSSGVDYQTDGIADGQIGEYTLFGGLSSWFGVSYTTTDFQVVAPNQAAPATLITTPLPAGLPLILAGLSAFALVRARRKPAN